MMHSTELNLPFSPHITAYSPNHAIALAKMARLAYQDKDDAELTTQLTQWGFSETEYACLSKNNTQVLVAANKAIVIIAFRGTEMRQIGDWMIDLKVSCTEFNSATPSWGFVHQGFLNALEDIRQEVASYLEPFRATQTPIFITGHSLGGALATLTAAELRMQNYPVHGLYTFGSPRVGNLQFARSFDRELCSRTFRFVNDKDIVTRVAPKWLGYRHTNDRNPLIIGVNKLKQQVNELQQQVNELQQQVSLIKEIWHQKNWREIFNLEFVADHDMRAYEQYLSEEAQSQTRNSTSSNQSFNSIAA